MSQKGVTLIELLVVTSIVIIIMVVVFPNYQNAKGQLLLDRAANKLSQDIRRAGEMAMSARMYGSPAEVPAGYGIYAVSGSTTYILYADNKNSNVGRYDGSDGLVETITLEAGVKINDVGVCAGNVSVNYRPPIPLVKISCDGGASEKGEIIITLSITSQPWKTRAVKANIAGLVDVN